MERSALLGAGVNYLASKKWLCEAHNATMTWQHLCYKN